MKNLCKRLLALVLTLSIVVPLSGLTVHASNSIEVVPYTTEFGETGTLTFLRNGNGTIVISQTSSSGAVISKSVAFPDRGYV